MCTVDYNLVYFYRLQVGGNFSDTELAASTWGWWTIVAMGTATITKARTTLSQHNGLSLISVKESMLYRYCPVPEHPRTYCID